MAVFFSVITNTEITKSKGFQEPSKAPFSNYIASTGIVESVDKNIEVGVPENGLVEKLWLEVGDKVKKNDPLFQIDTRDLASQLLVQEANILVERNNVERAKDLVERVQNVTDPRSISKEDLKTRQADYAIAKSKLKFAEVQVERTKTLLDRLVVRAPKDGVILQLNIREGELVTQNSPALMLGDIEHLQLRADIDEQNAGYFNKNSPAVAFPKNNTSILIPLTFTRIEPFVIPKVSLTGSSQERVDTRVLQVIYAFTSPSDYHMYVGQQVDVFIEKKKEGGSESSRENL